MQMEISISFDTKVFRVVYSETMCYTQECITCNKATIASGKIITCL